MKAFDRGYAENPGLHYCIAMENLVELITCLPPKQLAAVALAWDGLTQEEIGNELGITTAGVGHRLRRARMTMARACPELEDEIYARNYNHSKEVHRRRCVDCGALIMRGAERCRPCYRKHKSATRKRIRAKILASSIDGMNQSEIAAVLNDESPRMVAKVLRDLGREGVLQVARGQRTAKLYYRLKTHRCTSTNSNSGV